MLTETIVSLCDLAEAEGRLLKHKVLQTFGVGLLMLVAALMLFVALGLMLAAIYNFLLNWLLPESVYLIIAALSLVISGGVLWIALLLNRRQ